MQLPARIISRISVGNRVSVQRCASTSCEIFLHTGTCSRNASQVSQTLSRFASTSISTSAHRREEANITHDDDEDPNSRWKAWFKSHEYQPIWSKSSSPNSNHVQPLSHQLLDNSSRTLISQLDDITRSTDVNRHVDVPTVKQCNTMLARLRDMNINEAHGNQNLQGRSHRAYLIWKKMEYCADIRKDLHHGSGSYTYTSGVGVGAKYKYRYVIPRPNRETYLLVLSLHSTDVEQGKPGEIPKRALEIVKKMEQRFEEGHWDAEPSVMAWNQVIASWANSTHLEKAYEAASILQNNTKEIADASSYGNVFKACATTTPKSKSNRRAKELAGKVALRTWSEFMRSDLRSLGDKEENAKARLFDRGAYMLVNAIKAVGLVEDHNAKNKAIRSIFETACELGLVNTHVIHALKYTALSNIFERYTYQKDKSASASASAAHIFQHIRKEWKRNCNASSSGWK